MTEVCPDPSGNAEGGHGPPPVAGGMRHHVGRQRGWCSRPDGGPRWQGCGRRRRGGGAGTRCRRAGRWGSRVPGRQAHAGTSLIHPVIAVSERAPARTLALGQDLSAVRHRGQQRHRHGGPGAGDADGLAVHRYPPKRVRLPGASCLYGQESPDRGIQCVAVQPV